MRTMRNWTSGVGKTRTYHFTDADGRVYLVQDIVPAGIRIKFYVPDEVIEHWKKCMDIKNLTHKEYSNFFKRFTYVKDVPVTVVERDGSAVDTVIKNMHVMIVCRQNLWIEINFDINEVETEIYDVNSHRYSRKFDLGCSKLVMSPRRMANWLYKHHIEMW